MPTSTRDRRERPEDAERTARAAARAPRLAGRESGRRRRPRARRTLGPLARATAHATCADRDRRTTDQPPCVRSVYRPRRLIQETATGCYGRALLRHATGTESPARDAPSAGRAPDRAPRRSASATTGSRSCRRCRSTIGAGRAVGGRSARTAPASRPSCARRSGLLRPVVGHPRRARPGLRLAYVPQQAALDAIFPVSVLDFVLMGLQGTGNVTLRRRRTHAARARAPRSTRRAPARFARRAAARPVGRPAAARADGARAGDRRRRRLPRRADHRARRRRPSARCWTLIETLRARRGAAVVMVTHLVEDGLERADRALLLDRDHGVALCATAPEMHAAPEFQHIYGRFVGRGEERP